MESLIDMSQYQIHITGGRRRGIMNTTYIDLLLTSRSNDLNTLEHVIEKLIDRKLIFKNLSQSIASVLQRRTILLCELTSESEDEKTPFMYVHYAALSCYRFNMPFLAQIGFETGNTCYIPFHDVLVHRISKVCKLYER